MKPVRLVTLVACLIVAQFSRAEEPSVPGSESEHKAVVDSVEDSPENSGKATEMRLGIRSSRHTVRAWPMFDLGLTSGPVNARVRLGIFINSLEIGWAPPASRWSPYVGCDTEYLLFITAIGCGAGLLFDAPHNLFVQADYKRLYVRDLLSGDRDRQYDYTVVISFGRRYR